VTKLFNCPSSKFSLCLGSLLALALQPGFLQADTVKTDEWQIEADKVLRFDNPPSVIAEGNVVLTKLKVLPPKQETDKDMTSAWAILLEEDSATAKGVPITQAAVLDETPRLITEMTVKADWIAYDVEKNSIKAKGNVEINSETDQLMANEGVLNLTTETGTFQEATILREQLDLHLEGKKIEKTGVNTYRIQDGWVVTCKVDDDKTPPWSFAASETNVTQGEYAFMKHATFRIKDVPVFYTPWLMVPVGNKRQTGLLFPELSNSSNNGFGVNLPFFINISDSSDLTLYPEYYANRGFMPGFEYRYTLAPQKKGNFMASYLKDDLSDPSETEYREDTGYTHTNEDRYWVRGKVDNDFDNDVVTRFDLDLVSDRDYLTEFNSGVTGFRDSNERFRDVFGRGFQNKTSDQRVNSAKLLKSWDGMALEGVFLGINDIRQNTDSPTPLWKLPSLDFTGSQNLGDTYIALDWDTDYVNYYRENGVGGHRVDLFPRLSTPLPFGPYLEARAEAGVRETFYNIQTYGDGVWEGDNTQNRLLGDFHTEVGTTLLREFSFENDGSSGLTHSLRPFVQFDYISDTNQDDLPDFDSVDRIDYRNEITYGIDNFFNFFGKNSKGKETSSDYGYLKIKQSYDLRSEESDTPFSAVNMRLRWDPMDKARLIYKTDYDVYGDGFISHTLEVVYENSRGDSLNLDYRFGDDGDTEQINAHARAQIIDTVFAEYQIEHSLSEGQVIEQNISLLYQPACWSVELQSKYTPGDHVISVLFSLANIGNPLGIKL